MTTAVPVPAAAASSAERTPTSPLSTKTAEPGPVAAALLPEHIIILQSAFASLFCISYVITPRINQYSHGFGMEPVSGGNRRREELHADAARLYHQFVFYIVNLCFKW
ncbi:hypothetical protein DFH08DRAFT_1090432 [Mycena albidolilacea]|uniref:Uncharacterized protein n=1 Tax=Mycena albidolilacea TaxID=1033008 RepID=A0AAD7E6K2_9AGAR|nr:hypothetical protein DFH08DRAFT_1090432 [Mycena albidolilacea]